MKMMKGWNKLLRMCLWWRGLLWGGPDLPASFPVLLLICSSSCLLLSLPLFVWSGVISPPQRWLWLSGDEWLSGEKQDIGQVQVMLWLSEAHLNHSCPLWAQSGSAGVFAGLTMTRWPCVPSSTSVQSLLHNRSMDGLSWGSAIHLSVF